METRPWNLVADIGGTNARFGVAEHATGTLRTARRYPVSQFSAFGEALRHFLSEVEALGGWQPRPRTACLAAACPIEGDLLRITNNPWTIDRIATGEFLGGVRVEWINDFAAIGHAVPYLDAGDWRQICGDAPVAGRPIVVLGPGTGLGVCALVPSGAGYCVLEGEGGHVDFAPVDTEEIAVLQILDDRFGHVSVERLLSGPGIQNIYQSLALLAGNPAVCRTAEAVTAAALAGEDALAVKALAMFCRVLGSVAGNLCLTLGARGGVYLAGGILPRLLDFLEKSDFRQRFQDKGRFQHYLSPVPVRVIVRDDVGLHGAIRKLNWSE